MEDMMQMLIVNLEGQGQGYFIIKVHVELIKCHSVHYC